MLQIWKVCFMVAHLLCQLMYLALIQVESLKDKYYPVYKDASTDEYKKIYSGESTYVVLIYQDNKVLEIQTLPKHIDEVTKLLEEFGYREKMEKAI